MYICAIHGFRRLVRERCSEYRVPIIIMSLGTAAVTHRTPKPWAVAAAIVVVRHAMKWSHQCARNGRRLFTCLYTFVRAKSQ